MEPIHIFKLKLNKNEIQALKALLSKPSNRRNKSLKSIFDRLDGEDEITLYIDGAADLHSKTAGIGGVIYRNKDELFSFSEYLDDATNNEAEYLAFGVANYIYTISPQRIIMGGGVMRRTQLFPLICKNVLDMLAGYIQRPEIVESINEYVVPPGLGSKAGVLGAIALARRMF